MPVFPPPDSDDDVPRRPDHGFGNRRWNTDEELALALLQQGYDDDDDSEEEEEGFDDGFEEGFADDRFEDRFDGGLDDRLHDDDFEDPDQMDVDEEDVTESDEEEYYDDGDSDDSDLVDERFDELVANGSVRFKVSSTQTLTKAEKKRIVLQHSPAAVPRRTGADRPTQMSEAEVQAEHARLQSQHAGRRRAAVMMQERHDVNFFHKEKNTTKENNRQDEVVCRGIQDIVASIRQFAAGVSEVESPVEFYNGLLDDPRNAHLIRYIGRLAMGGPAGEQGWIELLADRQCREALVMAVVGRALKEHVFDDLLFGASEEVKEALHQVDVRLQNVDGFERTRARASAAYRLGTQPHLVEAATEKLRRQLETMLAPFWSGAPAVELPPSSGARLERIIQKAGTLARKMRMSPDVIYYWPPTFKDEEFDPRAMEALDLAQMIEESPYESRQSSQPYQGAVLREGQKHRSQAIVRVVCFPGLIAYRQHGGELAAEEIARDRAKRAAWEDVIPEDVRRARRMAGGGELTGQEGFRVRVIAKSVVMLQWGRQRLLTKEAGTAAHLDAMRDGDMAKYEQDRVWHRELFDLFESRQAGVTQASRPATRASRRTAGRGGRARA